MLEAVLQYLIDFSIVIAEATEMNDKNTGRFTLDMATELRTRLKIAAACKGITMRESCLSAIEQQPRVKLLGGLCEPWRAVIAQQDTI